MSGLVGYASSDEDDEVQQRPAKIAKTDTRDKSTLAAPSRTTAVGPGPEPQTSAAGPAPPPAQGLSNGPQPQPSDAAQPPTGPSAAQEPSPTTSPASPYTTERAHLRTLTMPTHPNFSIPSSPPPPSPNSEAALALSTTTKKFERFLALKAQGVHFNARLETSASLRNPGLVEKLREFAGVGEEESYASTLEGGVPVRWPGEWYVEGLVRENERRVKRAKKERGEVGFVKGGEVGGKSDGSSKAGTPRAGVEGRKTRFDR